MHESKQEGISIWFFIGGLLTVYGVMILGADIWSQSHPPAQTVVLADMRVGLWWGILLLVLGVFYCVKFRPGRG